jgi:hypothetical protein
MTSKTKTITMIGGLALILVSVILAITHSVSSNKSTLVKGTNYTQHLKNIV